MKKISLPTQVLIGAIAGIFIGIFFGDQISALTPIGTIYTMLLQAVVYPYIICTLLSSLGRLTPALGFKLFKKSWLLYVFLLIITFGIMLILSFAFTGLNITDIKPETSGTAANFSLLDLLIPQNLFAALSNNYVPAVVIFCILFGVSLQKISNKTSLLDLLDIVSKTCLSFWEWLVKLAPYAVFILLATTAGNVKLNQLNDLGEFLVLFFVGTLILTFWLIPIIICAFTGIRYKTLLAELRGALIISASTTLSVVALPYIYHAVTKFINKSQPQEVRKDLDNIVNTTLLISYPLGQLGNFFLFLFILFAALYFNHPLTHFQYSMLPIMTYFSSLGSPSTSINAVAFLAKWLNLPSDTTNLYIGISPIIRYGQILTSVMGFAFLAFLISYAYAGHLRLQFKKLITAFIIIAVLLSSFVLFMQRFTSSPGIKVFQRLYSFSLATDITKGVTATFLPPFDESQITPAVNAKDSLFRVQETGVLRVGYNADMRPFVFFNAKGKLVGYDVAYAYALAQALNARLEFVPFTWPYLVKDLEGDKFDIAMSSIYVTEQRLQNIAFTEPYYRSPVSFIVPQGMEDHFQSAAQIRNIKSLRIGTFNDPVLIPLIQQNFTNAQIVILPNISGNAPAIALAQHKIDAVVWSEAQTQIWVLGHPGYVSIVPNGLAAPFLMAYMVQRNSPQFLNFLNYWMELKKNDNFQNQVYDHWILVRPMQDNAPRWSIMRNVLHWDF